MPAVIQELGAVAGSAAFVGLVVLSALYVAHARGVKRLRDWAGGAPEGRIGAQAAQPRRSRTGFRLTPLIVGLLAAAGVATYGVSQVIGGDGRGDPGKPRASDSGASHVTRRSASVTPGSVTVAVLNGTTVDGLAAALRDQIAAAGFRRGRIDVFSDQQLAESVVEYAPGQLAAAKAVGRTLGIRRYEPVTANSRALAADATVIVVAGADTAGAAPATP